MSKAIFGAPIIVVIAGLFLGGTDSAGALNILFFMGKNLTTSNSNPGGATFYSQAVSMPGAWVGSRCNH
jgi:hypothetical protein